MNGNVFCRSPAKLQILKMSNFFNPGSPYFRRGVLLASVFSCTVVGFQVVMSDFGSQKHIFTPIQVYVNTKIDKMYEVTDDELYGEHKPAVESEKPFISLQRIDTKKT